MTSHIAEHLRATKNCWCRLVIVQHSENTGHIISFEGTKIFVPVQGYHQRIDWKAIKIEKHPSNINCEDDFKLFKTRKPLITSVTVKREHKPDQDRSRTQLAERLISPIPPRSHSGGMGVWPSTRRGIHGDDVRTSMA